VDGAGIGPEPVAALVCGQKGLDLHVEPTDAEVGGRLPTAAIGDGLDGVTLGRQTAGDGELGVIETAGALHETSRSGGMIHPAGRERHG
jgi:hypothetical protein